MAMARAALPASSLARQGGGRLEAQRASLNVSEA